MGLSIIVYGRLPSGGRHSRAGGNPATQRSRTLSEKNRKPHRPSFPQKAGIQKTQRNRNFIGKKPKPHRRHSRKSGNPATEKPQES
ncbi:hypothetical protein E4K42_12440, partial [Neisseria meningitidis]|nr:hypothetical protein [Neisseria meningitidis]